MCGCLDLNVCRLAASTTQRLVNPQTLKDTFSRSLPAPACMGTVILHILKQALNVAQNSLLHAGS